jgi:hypothetical protein
VKNNNEVPTIFKFNNGQNTNMINKIRVIKSSQLIINYLSICGLLFFLGWSNTARAQYNIGVGSNYIYSFGESNPSFQGVTYQRNPTQGYEATVNNSYQFKESKIKVILELGYRQLFFSGSSVDLSYTGKIDKFTMAFGSQYLVSDKIYLAGYVEIENNLNFEDYTTGKADLIRHSVSLEMGYALKDKLHVTLLYNRAYYPITDAYVIFNPQNQLRLGLTYQFLL